LLPNTEVEGAIAVAEQVRKLVETTAPPVPEMVAEGETLRLTVSCGVSTCVPDAAIGRERLLRNADRALYEAKHNGRNRVEVRGCEVGASMQLLERMSVSRSGGRGSVKKAG
jgi:diguanylate cyclase (GGDEF)-like protein